jgi:hypothetical protein
MSFARVHVSCELWIGNAKSLSVGGLYATTLLGLASVP